MFYIIVGLKQIKLVALVHFLSFNLDPQETEFEYFSLDPQEIESCFDGRCENLD